MEEARIAFMQSIGWSYDKMESMEIISPVVNVSCSYKKPSTFADIININTEVKELSRLKLTMAYTMTVGTPSYVRQRAFTALSQNQADLLTFRKNIPTFIRLFATLPDKSKTAGLSTVRRFLFQPLFYYPYYSGFFRFRRFRSGGVSQSSYAVYHMVIGNLPLMKHLSDFIQVTDCPQLIYPHRAYAQ